MRRRASLTIIGLGLVVSAAGCVDGFRGSNLQIDLGNAMPAQASPGTMPDSRQLPSNVHFTIYGIQIAADRDRLFELQKFEVHPIVDLKSPCFIDVGERVPHPGLHVSKFLDAIAADTGIPDYRNPPASATEAQKIDVATAAQRMMNIAGLGGEMGGIKAVTSASTSGYPAVAPSCAIVANMIPPPMCADEASNQHRLELCEKAWKDDPTLWEGTDRVLVAPLGGTTFGLVDGTNPVNLAPVGGAQFFIDEAVGNMDAYAVYYQTDGKTDPGNLLLYGTPTYPTRGVTHVHLTSSVNPSLTADMAVFANLGEDDLHF